MHPLTKTDLTIRVIDVYSLPWCSVHFKKKALSGSSGLVIILLD